MADQKARWVRRVGRDPRLDHCVGEENAAVGSLLLVHIVRGAGGEWIGVGHLNERAKALRKAA
jgi:hypothetical protein